MGPERPVAIVVEDEPEIRAYATRALQEHGWTIYGAGSGEEVFWLVEEHHDAELLITDVNMPLLDGLRLAQMVRHLRPHIKVLYLTGYGDRVFATRASLPDNESFLTKPFSVTGLVEAASLLVHDA